MIEAYRPYDPEVAKRRLALLGINRPVDRDPAVYKMAKRRRYFLDLQKPGNPSCGGMNRLVSPVCVRGLDLEVNADAIPRRNRMAELREGFFDWIKNIRRDAGGTAVALKSNGRYALAGDPGTEFRCNPFLASEDVSPAKNGRDGHEGGRFKVVRMPEGGIKFAFKLEEDEFGRLCQSYMDEHGYDETGAKLAATAACEFVSVTEWKRKWGRIRRSESIFVEAESGVVWEDENSPTTWHSAKKGYYPVRVDCKMIL